MDMVDSLKNGFNELVDLLARQANMERWCHCLLSTLRKELKLSYITLMVEQNHESRVLSSWVDNDFKYYSTPLTLDDYNGVPTGLFQQAKNSGQYVRAYVDKPYKAIWNEDVNAWCQLLLPIKMHSCNVGFIYAETKDPAVFESCIDSVENLLLLVASDISARVLRQEVIDHHLTRRSVEAELEIRNHSINEYLSLLRNLHEVTLSLSKATELDQLYRNAVYLGRTHLGIDRMAIFLTDFSKNEMQGTYGTDPEGNLVPRSHFTSPIPDHPLVHEALSRKDHVVVKENAPLYYGTSQVGTGWNAMIAMWNGNDCIGWLAADNLINQRMLTEHQKEILKLFGAALGQQIVIKRNHEQLSQLNAELEERVQQRTQELQATNRALGEANQRLELWSMQDGLTGVANRRFFDQTLQRYWYKAQKRQVPLSLIMIDVDYFKAFNDTYGHLEGDNCLKKVATTLAKITRLYKKSIFTRYGGEEFACLLPKVDAQDTAIIANEMLAAVLELELAHKATDIGRLTISVGCYTMIPNEGIRLEKLIDGADRALYAAKQHGRNQYFQWDD
ncbi:diguanylate cyclase [Photobacterium sp. SDRW27]|uniref:sensor domain-containing diguanylate cyclase n=1 Tax=Photobacterium obscurum TaxID=2829490 RepID=UPI0022432B43|nr:diguanylate cyclase [Photobacterium obscurum]MCW8328649.1 diguanylate cyclase [Photobacterium obscurum]